MRPHCCQFDPKTIRYYRALKNISKFLNKHLMLIILALGMWVFFFFPFTRWAGDYLDSDGYMRALRIYHLLLAPSFGEQPIFETNYPFGEILHWTRPMDLIWLAMMPFSLPLQLNLKDAVFFSGAFVSPMIGILAMLMLGYGLRRHFNVYLVLLGCSLLALNEGITIAFAPSFPDHHSLMVLLAFAAQTFTLCWLKKRQNKYLYLIGISLALSVFTVVEGVLLYVLFLVFFLYLYIFKNLSLQPAVKISFSFAVALSFFLLLNPPYEGVWFVDTGRISIFYVVAAWLAYAGFLILNLSHLHVVQIKILSLVAMTLGFLLILLVLFGLEAFKLPISPKVHEIFNSRIVGMHDVTSFSMGEICNYGTISIIALILNVLMLRNYSQRRLMIFNLCLLLPLFILSLFAIRALVFCRIFSILPYVACVDYLYKKSAFAHHKNADFPAYIWLIVLFFISLNTISQLPYVLKFKGNAKEYINPAICQRVRSIGGTLLTDVFFAVSYVWKCDVNTVSSPYHRNEQGIYDSHIIFNAETDGQTIPLLLRHQITQILLFDKYSNSYYKLDESHKNKLYYRLIKRENVPPYLVEIPTNMPQARLYEVKI
ncbi:MAG: hypothetical protein IJ864_00435 [Alphaproteobacteria bacterium]|nr:hypothetical protein [Alphaproteobacteria bacterium]